MSDGSETPAATQRLKRRLLDAAERLVEEAGGLQVSLDALTLDRVMKEAGVSRTSVYRVWDNREQFEIDLLCDLAGPVWQGAETFDDQTVQLARTYIAEHLGDLASENGRRSLFREVVRQAAAQNFSTLVRSPRWRTYVSLTASLMAMDDDEHRERLVATLTEVEHSFLARMSEFYADMATMIGLRFRDPAMTFRHVAVLGASVVEGLGIRAATAPSLVGEPLMLTGDDGLPQEWNLAAFGFFTLIDGLLELDPDYDPSAALGAYLAQLARRDTVRES